MKGSGRGILRPLLVGVVVLGLVALGAWRLDTASGDGATLSISGVPGSVSAGGADFPVQISVAGVTNLAAYEWQLAYDPNVVSFVSATDGGFVGSTGRSVVCQPPILPPTSGLQPGNVRIGCVTGGGGYMAGPSGGGLLSTATFRPVGNGAPNIAFVCAALADTWGEPISIGNVGPCVTASTPTVGPSETPGSDDTPEPTDTPGPTSTPGGPTATPSPTATPTGPTPTPTPLPPGYEAVELAAGCNPVASTYPDATPIGTIAAAVGPAGNLNALWQFEGGVWLGYSPAYPEVSDLTTSDLLDVVFMCVTGPGSFGRPIV
jgi:hypothetical protein